MVLLILSLLFLKHFIFDFLWQTPSEVANKGTYGNIKGLVHSLKHTFGTTVALAFFTPIFFPIALLDLLIHYHVDWVKMNYGEQDTAQSGFWRDLGLDQLAHYMTYILLAYIALRYPWK